MSKKAVKHLVKTAVIFSCLTPAMIGSIAWGLPNSMGKEINYVAPISTQTTTQNTVDSNPGLIWNTGVVSEIAEPKPEPTPEPTPETNQDAGSQNSPAPAARYSYGYGAVSVENLTDEALNNPAIKAALSMVGKTPYVWGGNTPAGLDCSGLTSYIYRTVYGKSIPRVTTGQLANGRKVDLKDAPVGSILVTNGHAALWAGFAKDGRTPLMIHSPHPGTYVTLANASWFLNHGAVPVTY